MGRIKKLKLHELVGHEKETDMDIYPITSTQAIFDENNKSLSDIIKELNNKGGGSSSGGSSGTPDNPNTPTDVKSKLLHIYKNAVIRPTTPEGGAYNFSTNTLQCPDGWQDNYDNLSKPVWTSTGYAYSDRSVIAWSTPISMDGTDDLITNGKVIINQLDSSGNIVDGGALKIGVNGDTAEFTGKKTYEFDGTVNSKGLEVDGNLNVGGNTTVNTLTANGRTTINNILDVTGESFLRNISSYNITNTEKITTKDLEVLGSAHFFKLLIDEIKSVGGQIILTSANAVVDKVEGNNLYFRCKDADGRQIDNKFKVGDQVICQTFNAATGNAYNASNKYYWVLVSGIGTKTIEKVDYHYITIDNNPNNIDGEFNPSVGDNIVQLGYRGTDDNARKSAIILSAYNTPDIELTAPSLAFYKSINNFNLKSHRGTYLDANGNHFVGEFSTSDGTTLESYINNLIQNRSPYRIDVYNDIIVDEQYVVKTEKVKLKIYKNNTPSSAKKFYGNFSTSSDDVSEGTVSMEYEGNEITCTLNRASDGSITFDPSELQNYITNNHPEKFIFLLKDDDGKTLASASINVVVKQSSETISYQEIVFDKQILTVIFDDNNLNGYLYVDFICKVRSVINNSAEIKNDAKVQFDFCNNAGTTVSSVTKNADKNNAGTITLTNSDLTNNDNFTNYSEKGNNQITYCRATIV